MTDEVYVDRHDPIATIAPELYGHFAEHLGRCIYGGVWVGEDAQVPTEDGLRRDTLDLLAAVDVPVLRWPGGCFADDYHWADGVGPREERPRRRNLHWAQGRAETFEESNAFGTDEFLLLCDAIDAEPYLAANVGTGTPQEALDWAEYCNYDGDTDLADRRRENDLTGDAGDGYGVPYWGVGNENWGCGGRLSPERYAEEFRQYANYLRTFSNTMSEVEMELVAVGHHAGNWNRRFLDQLEAGVDWVGGSPYSLLDHLAVHRYYNAGGDTDFTETEYYELFANARQVAADVDDAADALSTFAPEADVGVMVDEWGVWHPEAVPENGLEQENTVRDALVAAGVLDDLNARADVVTMANIAQTVNVLQCLVQTDETDAWATPTYEVFDLYAAHTGATAVRTVVESEARTVGEDTDEDDPDEIPLVSASASADEDGVNVTLTNRDLDASRPIEVHVDGDVVSVDDASVLFEGRAPEEHSTPDVAFDATDVDLEESGDALVVEAPASSLVALELDVE